jgi:cell division protein FtsA
LVTNDIAYLLKVDLPEAERLKCREATCDLEGVGSNDSVMVNQPGQGTGRPMKRRVLCEIVESRMKETARFVGKALDDAGFGGERDATVVLTGGGSLLGGVDVVFKDALGVSKVKSSWPKLSGQHARHLGVPEATAAVGLARLALETNRDSLQPVHRDGGFMDRIRAIGTRLLSDRG